MSAAHFYRHRKLTFNRGLPYWINLESNKTNLDEKFKLWSKATLLLSPLFEQIWGFLSRYKRIITCTMPQLIVYSSISYPITELFLKFCITIYVKVIMAFTMWKDVKIQE